MLFNEIFYKFAYNQKGDVALRKSIVQNKQNAFSSGRRWTTKWWMRSTFRTATPHPSAFGIHLLPLEKAYFYAILP
jgi:hypothetical protein